MMRVPTRTGEVVTLSCFSARRGTIETLRDLQAMIPRYEITTETGLVRVSLLNFDTEAVMALNREEAA